MANIFNKLLGLHSTSFLGDKISNVEEEKFFMSCWFIVHALLLCGCELCAISAIPGHNQWWILNIFAGWSSCKLCVAFSMWTFEHLDTCAQPGPFQVCMRWYSTNLSWIMTSQCSLSRRIIHLHCSLLKAISSAGSFRDPPPHHLQIILYIKTKCTFVARDSEFKSICIQAMCRLVHIHPMVMCFFFIGFTLLTSRLLAVLP